MSNDDLLDLRLFVTDRIGNSDTEEAQVALNDVVEEIDRNLRRNTSGLRS